MNLRPIPIGTKPYFNIDPVSKGATVADTCIDGYFDESGTLRRRGALKAWLDLGTGAKGNGLFAWHQMERLVAVSGGRVWLIAQDGSTEELTGAVLNDANVVFADGNKVDGSPWLYMADGGYPVYSTGNALQRLTEASGAPSAVSHVAWTQGRFLVNQVGSRKFYATDTNPETGTIDNAYFLASDNPLTAESRPDNADYLGVSWEELLVWGKQGLEIWRDDAVFFSPVAGAFTPAGILAPYSVVEADNTVFALCSVDGGSKRAVIKMQGRVPQVVSLPIERVLQGYAEVSDAIGWLTPDSEYVLTFPSAGETWCYDYRNDAWYPWSRWDVDRAERQEFLGRHSATMWGRTFMQSRIDGKIYEYDRSTFADDGQMIRTEYVSGNIGSGNKTRMNKLRIYLKRGQGDESGSEPVLLVRYKDERNDEGCNEDGWNNSRSVSLGKQGKRSFYRDLNQMGSFATRQFSFILTDNADLALVRLEADMERLSR